MINKNHDLGHWEILQLLYCIFIEKKTDSRYQG